MPDPAALIAYLRDRYDEDTRFLTIMQDAGERKAAAATPGDLADAYSIVMAVLADPQARECVEWWGERGAMPNDTRRLLADIESKRRILDYCESARLLADASTGPYRRRHAHVHAGLVEIVAEMLAEPFRDRPDFPGNWKLAG